MKKLVLLALILFALYQIGTKKAPPLPEGSDGAKMEIDESISDFFGTAYDGLAICVSKCGDIVTEILG